MSHPHFCHMSEIKSKKGAYYPVGGSSQVAARLVPTITRGVFSLSLDPFLPYVRAHSSHISPFKFCFCSGRRRPCARPRHESAHRGRSRQKATTRNGNSLHQHILSHSIVLDEVFGPFVKRHVGTLVVYFFSFFMSNRRVNDSSIFSNRVNDSFVF